MREKLRSVGALIVASMRVSPSATVASFVLSIVQSLGFAGLGYWGKFITDAAVRGDADAALRWSAAFVLYVGAVLLVAGIGIRIRLTLTEKASYVMERRVAEMAGEVPGIEHFERPEFLDRLDLLRQDMRSLAMAHNALVNYVGTVARFVGVVGVLGTLHPVLLLLPVFGIPSIIAGAAAERLQRKAEEDTAEDARMAQHLFDTATTAAPGKELRIFRLEEEILGLHAERVSRIRERYQRVRMRQALYRAAGWLVFGLGFVGAIVFVALRAANGEATVGDVFLAVTLAGQVNQSVAGLVQMTAWLGRTLRTVGRYVWLHDYARTAARAPAEPAPAPERLRDGIAFDDVSFRYPGTDADVLAGVSLRIPAGATVAIVGENGAGKTTLVKLLCRFYEPSSGRITVDGVDLARIPSEEWRSRVSGAFQDFARLELLARETVAVGHLPAIDDAPAVRGALERAGAPEVVEQMPDGLETQLGRTFEGIELSLGQWQKLALGRAMMRGAPLLLVLDEPTASLDAETEHKLFERYAEASRARAADGAITVLVSHRFSTVRMADLILVVNDGRIAEAGSHDELMARGGLYADLYSIQARAYR